MTESGRLVPRVLRGPWSSTDHNSFLQVAYLPQDALARFFRKGRDERRGFLDKLFASRRARVDKGKGGLEYGSNQLEICRTTRTNGFILPRPSAYPGNPTRIASSLAARLGKRFGYRRCRWDRVQHEPTDVR